jgi:hypothetical protein
MRWQILPLVVLPLSLLWSPDASAQSAPAADAATPPTQPATPPALPPESAPAPPAASTKLLGVELLSLRVMHEKNMLSDAEYESALRDLNDTSGAQASESMSIVAGG